MRYYRFFVAEGDFEFARDYADGTGRADYFDNDLGIWVASNSLHSEVNNDGSWISCPEQQVLIATSATTTLAG